MATTNKTIGTISGSRELVDDRHTTTQSDFSARHRATRIAVCVKARRRTAASTTTQSLTDTSEIARLWFRANIQENNCQSGRTLSKAPRYSSSAYIMRKSTTETQRSHRTPCTSVVYPHTDNQSYGTAKCTSLQACHSSTIISNYSFNTHRHGARPRSPPSLEEEDE